MNGAIVILGAEEPGENQYGITRVFAIGVLTPSNKNLIGIVGIKQSEEDEDQIHAGLLDIKENGLNLPPNIAQHIIMGAFDDLFGILSKEDQQQPKIDLPNFETWAKNFVPQTEWATMTSCIKAS